MAGRPFSMEVIVKVQVGLESPDEVLMYIKSEEIYLKGEITPYILKKMDGRKKDFFVARVTPTVHDGHEIKLLRRTSYQDW